MLTIGELSLKTYRPDDLDAQLVDATGCTSAEIETLLASGPDRAARAVLPFLAATETTPDVIVLARAIARDPAALDAIRGLYAEPAAEPETEQ